MKSDKKDRGAKIIPFPVPYPIDQGPEWRSPAEKPPEGYMGTWTPQARYLTPTELKALKKDMRESIQQAKGCFKDLIEPQEIDGK